MLKEVILFNNQITDLSALEGCSRLSFVSLCGNPLSDAALGVIERLRCRGVRIPS
jgi:Leucine-rich repeat (LRR) protein